MFVDIVFPKDNEKKFIKIAKELGYNGLCFVYTISKFNKTKFEKLKKQTNIKLYSTLLTEKPNKNFDLVISESKNEIKDRKKLEQKNFDLLFNFENQAKSDFIHQRNSGLNHIFCKLAKKTAIGISFSNLINLSSFERARAIGRIEQNLKLCRKYNVKTVFASFAKDPLSMRSPLDLRAFLNTISPDKEIAKNSLLNLDIFLKQNIKKKEKNYISKDIKIIE